MTNSEFNRFPAITRIVNGHVYKQAIATFASCLLSVTGGLTFGYTAVLLPQLEKDAEFPYDKGYDSWIASISPFAMMFGCFCTGPLSDAIGRRKGQMFLIFPFIAGWIVMGLSRNNSTMLVGRFITGLCTGAIRPLTMVYIGEVCEPKQRAMALFCPALAAFIGCLISHTVGYYTPWRIGCFIFIIPNIICFLILLPLKESPIWLITKGQIEEGTEVFKWFRGNGELAERELKLVLENQNKETTTMIKQLTSVIFTIPFLKSVGSMFFVFVAVQLCGINTLTFYAEDMFRNTFGGEVDPFLLMIVTDVIRVIFTGAMCLLAKILPRKMTFLISCFGTSLVLAGLVVYLQIKPEGLVWLAITFLVAYIAIASVLTSISWSFVAEIFPNKVRGLGSGISSLMSFSLLFISVKITPSIMENFGEGAMYGSFAVVTIVAALVLCFILPETNGKTLQDIENKLYKKNTKVEIPPSSESIEKSLP